MNKSDQEILVVDRVTLFADRYFQGFCPAAEMDYYRIIMENYFYKRRGDVEPNPAFKQPIPYVIIAQRESKLIFAYQRASGDTYHERRLRGKWSWGIGGHVDKGESDAVNPILSALRREIAEEIDLPHYYDPMLLGYINDDQTEVGMVHFGLLYLVLIDAKKIKPKDKEMSWGGFMSYDQLEEICALSDGNVESWSEIALEPLRHALGIDNGGD